MRALIFNKHKSQTQIVISEVERPIPDKGEILIRIQACSVNAADYRSMKMGITPKRKYFGADIAGIVESVGENISQFTAGDEVVGDLSDFGFGGFAEFAIAPEKSVVRKPGSISFETAAAIPLAAVTALHGLRKGQISANQEVLIVGSSGGVGTFAIQLAKYFGGKVTAVCSTKNVSQAHELGADRVIDYTVEDFTRDTKRYDLILAVNGNYPLRAYNRLLTPAGTCCVIGGSMGQILKSLVLGWCFSLGPRKMRTLSSKSNPKDLEFLVQLAADGRLTPVLEKVISLEEAPVILENVMQGHAQGKVVIRFKGER